MKTVLLLFFITAFISCGQNKSVEKTANIEKEQYDNRSVEEISKSLEIQMLDYI
ncbi:hypothetical protein [Flavobacterium sp.]|uniref:hypothetical protein n=1 Tax=Flavobacterium sp. TaxID=239 RepID=UPI0026316CFC|nr:hypothetical protein [Flavobacterium sp.]